MRGQATVDKGDGFLKDRRVLIVVPLVLILVSITVLCNNVEGETWIVDKAGGPDHDFKNLTQAYQEVNEHDTLIVRKGTYWMPEMKKSLTIIGEDRNRTFIDNEFDVLDGSLNISDFTIEAINLRGSPPSAYNSHNNTIHNCTFIDYDYDGVAMFYSHNNTISNCSFLTNIYYGIRISNSRNASVINCTFKDNSISVFLDAIEDYFTTTLTNNYVNEREIIWFTNLTGGTINETYGQIFLINSSNVIIENQNISFADSGMEIIHSDNITIRNSSIHHNQIGIRLVSSENCHIEDSEIYRNNWSGIHLRYANDNVVSNCTLWADRWGESSAGINFYYSTNNIVTHTSIYDVVRDTYAIMFRDDSDNNTIDNCTIENHWGRNIILLYEGIGNKIVSCIFSNVSKGIYSNSEDHLIAYNTIINSNKTGVELRSGASNNAIHHNNFIDCQKSPQAMDEGSTNQWDNGKKGNFWSDYSGIDNNDDGIGDTSYTIDSDSKDRYPLMYQWSSSVIVSDIIVDDDGGSWANYSSIQDAIDNAAADSIIRVYDGIYRETLTIETPVRLIGNGSETTRIVGGAEDHNIVITVIADWTEIAKFMIQGTEGSGIIVFSDHVTLNNLEVRNCTYGGIEIHGKNNKISSCLITNNSFGITIEQGGFNVVNYNNISDNKFGINLRTTIRNQIHYNEISNNQIDGMGDALGIVIDEGATVNEIIYNDIMYNEGYGIQSEGGSAYNLIHHNNFIDNNGNSSQAFDDGYFNIWDNGDAGNFWSDHESEEPYILLGKTGATDDHPIDEEWDGVEAEGIKVWVVDDDDGWWNDYKAIRAAIDNANNGDYVVAFDGDHVDFDARKSVTIIGNESHRSRIICGHNYVSILEDDTRLIGLRIVENSNRDGIHVHADDCLIENIVFDNGTRGIDLSGNNNLVRNCIFMDSRGIWGSRDGSRIVNSVFEDISGWSIYLPRCDDWIISNCTFSSGDDDGIYIQESSGVKVISCRFTDLKEGLTIYRSREISIERNQFDNASIIMTGEVLEDWTTHTFDSNTMDGREVSYIRNRTGGMGSGLQSCFILANVTDFTIFNENEIMNLSSVQIGFSNNITVSNVDVKGTGLTGIKLYKSSNFSLARSSVTGFVRGVSQFGGEYTAIERCSFNDNHQYAIYISMGNESRILGCEVQGTGPYYDERYFPNQTLGTGIYLEDSDDNVIGSNHIFNNTIAGIEVYRSDGNLILNNSIDGNGEHGIVVRSYLNIFHDPVYSRNNTLSLNSFNSNNGPYSQGFDDTTYNYWYMAKRGNYWSDYTGSDDDGDGIGDTPYFLDGNDSAKDPYPLMEPGTSVDVSSEIWTIGETIKGETITVVIVLESASADPEETYATVEIEIQLDGEHYSTIQGNITIPVGQWNQTLEQSLYLNESGNYTFKGKVIHDDVEVETAEAAILSEVRDHSFKVTMDRSSSKAKPEDEVEYTLTIENQGNVPQRFRLSCEEDWIVIDNITIYILPHSEGTTTVTATIPSGAEGVVNFTILTESISLDDEVYNSGSASVEITVSDPTADPIGLLWIFLGVTALGAIGLVGVWSTDRGRYLAIPFLSPLYSKLKRDNIQDHDIRGRIVVYLDNDPGAHFNKIKKQLDLKNGTAGYHLRVLEKGGFIKSVSDGMYRRFYPHGYSIPNVHLGNMEKKIVMEIIKNPGISQKRLSTKLKISASTITYHVKDLKEKGIVTYSRKTGCQLTDEYRTILKDQKDKL